MSRERRGASSGQGRRDGRTGGNRFGGRPGQGSGRPDQRGGRGSQRPGNTRPGGRGGDQGPGNTRPGDRSDQRREARPTGRRDFRASDKPEQGRSGSQAGGALFRNKRLIEGWNPVLEALAARRQLEHIWLAADQHKSADALRAQAKRAGIPVEEVDRFHLSEIANSEEHQGVVALAPPFPYVAVDDILAGAKAKGEQPFILILDHIEDPHNLGSLIRTAECAGVHGAVIPDRRAVGVTPAVGKASAGAIEHLPIAQVGNLVQEIERLKEQGVWVVGAHMSGDSDLFNANMTGPVALVIGAEGKGLSRLVAERCDMLVSIPMSGRVGSLNASVAGALLMYEVTRSRVQKA